MVVCCSLTVAALVAPESGGSGTFLSKQWVTGFMNALVSGGDGVYGWGMLGSGRKKQPGQA